MYIDQLKEGQVFNFEYATTRQREFFHRHRYVYLGIHGGFSRYHAVGEPEAYQYCLPSTQVLLPKKP